MAVVANGRQLYTGEDAEKPSCLLACFDMAQIRNIVLFAII